MNIDEALICADDEWENTLVERTLAAEVRRLREENERMRNDAERYQWLRDSDYDLGELFRHIQTHGLTNTGIDSAIDAARGAKPEPAP